MSSETDVINRGLRSIGATRITSRTDGSNSANVADDIYDEVRDELLRCHPWNFATKRTQLSQSATDPEFEFDYAYPLPSDWIMTISVHNNDAGHGTVLYREEFVGSQKVIVASSDQLYLRYVYRVTDANQMSADFRTALSYAIAQALAIPLASSNTLEGTMAKRARSALLRAQSRDALGGYPELRPRGSWASSRGGRKKDDFLSD